VVFIFQEGHLQGPLDFMSKGGLLASNPILIFAVVFGLSTDYGVFLLTRIKEARDQGAENRDAVALVIQRSGRIVTAAAVLFSVAVGAFSLSRIEFLKEFSVGVVAGVLLDASLVRVLLVPSLMALVGEWNWWAPAPLRRLYRRLKLEG
jgi:uncharacterized membrane protein YdfJ with MMPL/SSD domain